MIPDDVTSQSVTVSVTDLTEDEEGEPQIVRVPVPGPGQEIRVPLPYRGKMRVEVYDGAVESGTLLHSQVIDSPPDRAQAGNTEVHDTIEGIEEWQIDER